ncbi:MAG: hypothetical protein H6Q04_2483 [Acidobacteria bacterium]|nr:hypothetical protein [Acidobacteriota bacterium]
MNGALIRMIPVLLGMVLFFPSASAGQTDERWRFLASGLEYGSFRVKSLSQTGEGTIHVVRIDPAKARLKLLLASEYGNKSRTTAGWCKEIDLVSAINAGMYHKDLITNVGYLRNGAHIQNRRWNGKYKSVLAFDPKKAGIPAAIMVDLDKPGAMDSLSDYNAVVQNLRLVKGDEVNVWARQDQRWSEAAVGMDRDGRVLFLFCRLPLTMRHFNEVIQSRGLGVVRMMHAEGGPIASLSIRASDLTLDLAGSYGTNIRADDTNEVQWPIPNVLGVQAR